MSHHVVDVVVSRLHQMRVRLLVSVELKAMHSLAAHACTSPVCIAVIAVCSIEAEGCMHGDLGTASRHTQPPLRAEERRCRLRT